MNITKDEAAILSEALDRAKFGTVKILISSDDKRELMIKLEQLVTKLDEGSKDHRRLGRKSLNDFTDLLKRFIK